MKILQNVVLIIRFPFLLPRNRWTGKVNNWGRFIKYIKEGKYKQAFNEPYFFQYTELDSMPDGWRKVFGVQMCRDIKKALLKKGLKCLYSYRISEIKEKWGYLHWYDFGATEEVHKVIQHYEWLSMCYCIHCGKPVRYMTQGWIEYVCEDCAKEFIKPEYIEECRLTEDDIPQFCHYDSEGNKTEIDLEVDFKKMWNV